MNVRYGMLGLGDIAHRFASVLIKTEGVSLQAVSARNLSRAEAFGQKYGAKKAYGEGKRLFDAKKFADAVDKFKESYRLSRNPLLLYNVGFTLDQKALDERIARLL